MSFNFDKKKVLIIPDLHISDKFKGNHKDYLKNCFDVLNMITNSIMNNGITHLILLGDLIGVGYRVKTLKERENLLKVMTILQEWNALTNFNVYSVVGNHDIGSKLTDFDMFNKLGLIKTPKRLDLKSTRFHFFNYGEEGRTIEIAENRMNVGLFHTELLIDGQTNWYMGDKGTELSTMDNLYGIDIAIAGHIHNPSERIFNTSIRDKNIQLFYPGNPTRPKKDNLWNVSYGVIFNIEDDSTTFDIVSYKLKDSTKLFTDTIEDLEIESESSEESLFSLEKLEEILSQLSAVNLGNENNYASHINKLSKGNKEVEEIALKYLNEAQNSLAE